MLALPHAARASGAQTMAKANDIATQTWVNFIGPPEGSVCFFWTHQKRVQAFCSDTWNIFKGQDFATAKPLVILPTVVQIVKRVSRGAFLAGVSRPQEFRFKWEAGVTSFLLAEQKELTDNDIRKPLTRRPLSQRKRHVDEQRHVEREGR